MALRRNGHNAERRTKLKFKSVTLILGRVFVTFTIFNHRHRAAVHGEHRADKIIYRSRIFENEM